MDASSFKLCWQVIQTTDTSAQASLPRDGASSRDVKGGGIRLALAGLFCVACVAFNIAGSRVAGLLGITLFLDCMGTMCAALIGGPIAGVLVGYLTSLFNALFDSSALYYGLISVLVALAVWLMQRGGWFKSIPKTILAILVLGLLSGGLSSIITWWVFGFSSDGISTPLAQKVLDAGVPTPAVAQLVADVLIDLYDKAIELVVTLLVVRLMPQKLRSTLDFSLWQQSPLSEAERKEASENEVRTISLRARVAIVIVVAVTIIGSATSIITYFQFWNAMVDKQADYALGVADLAKKEVDGNRVEEYLRLGDDAPGYHEVESALASIRDSFEDVAYVYVYQIREDGCHVVLDPDTADESGSDPGSVIDFDPEFLDQRANLLVGGHIDPVVSNDSYGWLLSVYEPIFDDAGTYEAYVCVDILMNRVRADCISFLARNVSLFAAFLILVCVLALWLSEYGVILPLNSMTLDMAGMSFGDDESREKALSDIHSLAISTGDEVENLYHSIEDMVGNTVYYIFQSERQASTIARMQDNLIMVMADLVESRDLYTGEHVRKTAAYVEVILKQMQEEGIYADQVTDEFVSDVVHSAPLHDIGKIVVPDAILNCPRRLTDEEFAEIQKHPVAGARILEKAVGAMSDPGYLDEARRLAEYHHEKWAGGGYPHGIAGEEIPLSARVMAVADVFDALVSKRSYKDGMPVDKAISIIRESSGTHFDPQVVQAFLDAEDEVRAIAEEHGDAEGAQMFDVHEEPAKE